MPPLPARLLHAALLSGALLAPCAPVRAAEPPPDAVGERAVTRLYLPAHAAFASAAHALERRIGALCASPGQDALEAARAAYVEAVAGFSAIEPLRVGPLLDDNRLNRLFYWPDTRRVGERQLRALLAEASADPVTVDSMPERSVAVQGLPALERLLFGQEAGALAGTGTASADEASASGAAGTGTGTGTVPCDVALAIAGNVARIGDALGTAWTREDGIARQMSAPRAGDALFRTPEEVVRSLLTQLVGGLELVLDEKLAPMLAADPPTRRGAPFRRSAATYVNLAGDIETLRALAVDSGLAAAAHLEKELAFEFRIAGGHLGKLAEVQPAPPLPNALDEEEAGLVRALSSTLSSVRDSAVERLAPALGVRTGFNAGDGD